MVVFTHTNALAKDFQKDRKVKAQPWHSFFRWNGVGEWTPERMGKKKFPRVIIWDEVCTVPRHILEKFIDYLLEQKCQVICCGDDAQPPPFFGKMPHGWLKEHANYYEEVLTDYRAKCPELRELKKRCAVKITECSQTYSMKHFRLQKNGNIFPLNGSQQTASYQLIYFSGKSLPKNA